MVNSSISYSDFSKLVIYLQHLVERKGIFEVLQKSDYKVHW